ncbi:LacI family DNA-binding transcriptional regulator [Falsirhodobacter halotolerans]|uniref:LacI family DNA-binding transcriptional regulator n=1 Tax=Falsirhodobacter halotolerans TaxID=1146892 RepID=UPI001FD03E37|nr:LacI family DNA-binding transcriptional regulator [Falsirhodobacter halotolerans]MCJ8140958.1 LacI family DNA-binding transcriptional regulator [Falsirhodobacter halotolerans]
MDTAESTPRRTTVVTLSELAGVAPSTVTRALRGDTRISEATRRKILTLAREHGYTPNAQARTLSSGRSGLYGLVIGPASNPFYVALLHEATTQARARGVRLLIIHAGAGPIEDSTADALLQYQVDGCIIASANLSSRAAEICARNNVPLVMVNRVALSHGCFVTCDNRGGGADVAHLLLDRGHARFGIVHTSSTSSTAQEREEGFTAELARAGRGVTHRFDGQSTYEGGFAAGQALAQMPPGDRPSAVFAVSDIMAMGLLDALRLAQVAVPEEIAVAGFDGLAEAGRAIYDLTTVEQPLDVMVRRAFEMLAARSGNHRLPDELIALRGRLILRGSSGHGG